MPGQSRVLLIDAGQSGSRARYLEGVPQSASPSVKQPVADATPGVTFSGAGSSPPSGTRTSSRSRRGRARAERRGPGLPRHGRDYRALRVLLDDPVDFVAAGLTGFDGDAAAVARALGTPVIVSNDAVTAHLGALGGEPGVVIVAGTGVIALAVGADGRWARADGLGSRLGDDGGGYWIGRRGLAAALRARDGRPGGSPELLRHAVGRFGERIVPAVYDADDPVAVIADFARDVADAANAGDEHALSIWSDAASELAATALTAARAVAATGPSGPTSKARPARSSGSATKSRRPGSSKAAASRAAGSSKTAASRAAGSSKTGSAAASLPAVAMSYSGGLFAAGAILLDPLRAQLPALLEPLGGPLDGVARLLERPPLFKDLIFEAGAP